MVDLSASLVSSLLLFFFFSELHFPVRGGRCGGKKHVRIIISVKTAQAHEQALRRFCEREPPLLSHSTSSLPRR